ncbi:MAG: 4-hydroxythreonine-4-phosphate dehydrogenase PdxA [Sandaracinus sp.]|nr:4-hydroxythreonine-4-phosphate dehydrogenase PdxA [Sandaracinus sp.]MCB9614422.1 4-hydroxythreonine-4-phosphate dehydrogenase PdxA [Sandaracinus sp.]MCB9619337.1 4-hydroxythreonine-4-phosphate dehydrogenase PdxA [Sandaracinus sp.]MCB9633627.1 4-hydroxythreonine-4-phosphate dehydrogenase PdxA [Sandaracinus sp.]
MSAVRPLAVSLGDPAGVGPQVGVSAIAALRETDAFVVFGDGPRLARAFAAAGVPLRTEARVRGDVSVIDVARWSDATIAARAPTPEGGRDQLVALDAAIDVVTRGEARALVTGPVSKAAITSSGVDFVGHTERLAQRAGLDDDGVTMLFLGPRLRVGLVTTHLSVRDAAAAVTEARVHRTIAHVVAACHALGLPRPKVEVTGVNPHAGEGGLFGDEESRAVAPAIRASASLVAELLGPMPAEASFRRAAAGTCDAVVTMLHDQATIASKLLDWGEAVNVTWGLPYVRTSVDHGVAYDAAAAGSADDDGMRAAVTMATRLSPP